MTILVTGGAGVIGSHFILDWLAQHGEPGLHLDKIAYARKPENLVALAGDSRYILIPGDIGNQILVDELLAQHAPRAIVNFAAESHVDRSISGPSAFIETNIVGTFNLLECARRYVASLEASARDGFRFLHVSTDEVYGSLEPAAPPFREDHQYQPN
ncbi:GDP-mannose 4,6-dehydratase, partial [Achromobacter sp. Marseille-Q0513]|uniref:GDP-mannose 4,6-dehydratase n=1 Tax=Achromobacter sp. Marseille-Q0513 TaxID=2829161 RepID=UPI001B8F4362